MRGVLFILFVVILLVGAGVVLARPVDQDGSPAAYPIVTATAEPYPVVWPTVTAVPTDTPQPTAISAPAEPTKTPPPVLGEPPTVPSG